MNVKSVNVENDLEDQPKILRVTRMDIRLKNNE